MENNASQNKTRSIRATDEIFTKFKEITESIGSGTNESLSALINAYELQQAKQVLTGQAALIDDFKTRADGIIKAYISALELSVNAEDRIEEVLAEVPNVRKDFGYPPLVTPTSQIIGTQAVMNVLTGRYNTFTKEAKALLRGEYGILPGEVNREVRELAIGDEEIIFCRPADLLHPELAGIREQFGDFARTDEDILSCAMFPQIAPDFIKKRDDLIVHDITVEWVR